MECLVRMGANIVSGLAYHSIPETIGTIVCKVLHLQLGL